MKTLLLKILGFTGFSIGFLIVFLASIGQAQSTCTLPTIEYFGEGQGTYGLPVEANRLIVKRLQPFRFEVLSEPAVVTQTNGRVWTCAGNCTLPAIYHEAISLGTQPTGTVFSFIVIDDDTDDRLNTLIAGDMLTPTLVHTITQQGMAQRVEYTTTIAAEWHFYANDSVGIVGTCAVQTPTATPTSTPPPPTETPTPVPTGLDPTDPPTLKHVYLPAVDR